MADTKDTGPSKTLEMRVAELEDKLAHLHISEEEMKTYHKVASKLGTAPCQQCTASPCIAAGQQSPCIAAQQQPMVASQIYPCYYRCYYYRYYYLSYRYLYHCCDEMVHFTVNVPLSQLLDIRM